MKPSTLMIWLALMAFVPGCQKEQHVSERPHRELNAKMSDEQILRFVQLDPTALHAKKDVGVDGFTTIYSDETNEVWITRSVVTGVVVMRMKPSDKLQIWELGKP